VTEIAEFAMTDSHDRDDGESESTAYETRDVKLRPLVVFAAGLTAVGLVVYLVVFGMMRLFTGQAARRDAQLAPSSAVSQPQKPGEERLPPEPRIQANPAADLKALRAGEDAVLTSYGWVDRQAGLVRVPIDVAMKLVVAEGLPVRASDAPAAATAPVGPAARPQAGAPGAKGTR
jgi:hypothetical protein